MAGVPAPLSAIVLKLLAKTAEERYQTAGAVEADLRRCLAQWRTHSRIDIFGLGLQDVSDRLLIPEKLYGREREIDILHAAFGRVVASGTPELVLVGGYSGIGKSSVVHELHKALVVPRGLFVSGKFDQYKRDMPYATLAQAFQSVIHPLLGQSETDLGRWRDALREALGTNGQLMVNLIPELELVMGNQPPVPELPAQDAQNRFQMVFRRFLSVFARPEHPLVLFLDDLQWLDAGTLDLLQQLVSEPEVRHLLLVGSYRDNEVGPDHVLTRKLAAIRRSGVRIQEIVLASLALDDVNRLVCDSLHCAREVALPLAQLVHEKTAGNPFFAIQFIGTLAEEGLLAFEPASSTWTWDLERIRAKGFAENVVDLMIGKLHRLSAPTREVLEQLACLGNVAEIATLVRIHGGAEEAIDTALWQALHAGFIVCLGSAYKFVHDRIEEAAYALIPVEKRAAVHLRIGRTLAAQTPPEKLEEKVFEIANQFNRAIALITAREEREQVAELNLIAGKRAKASTAYASALNYFAAAAALLGDDWNRYYSLLFGSELQRAECEFLSGELVAAEERLCLLAVRAMNLVDHAAVTCLRVRLYTALNQSDRAVAVSLEYLRRVGVAWDPHPTQEEVADELARLWRQLDSRSIRQLVDLPAMKDPRWRATMDVLSDARRTAQFTDQNLYRILLGRMANLSLEHGNSDGSCVAYAWLGLGLGPWLSEHAVGRRFGELSLDLVDQHGLDRFKTRVYLCFGSSSWAAHPDATLAFLQRAFERAQNTGDLTGTAYAYNVVIAQRLVNGHSLRELHPDAERALAFVQKGRFGVLIEQITGHVRLIRALRGLASAFGSFTDATFDERQFEQHLQSNPGLRLAGCWYWIRKLQARCYAGDYAAAIEAASEAQRLLWTTQSHFEIADYHFYAALAHAGSWATAPGEVRQQHLEAVIAHHQQLSVWAQHAPEHFANRAALLSAEVARLQGRDLDAGRLYEEAIRLARKHGFVQNEAIANELAARFYAVRGSETIANESLRAARNCYLQWGAEGKVRQLEQLHPQLRDERGPLQLTTTVEARQEQLDFATVVKMSQTLSGEIILDKLIETLMQIAVEHAGAERGLLVLQRGGEQRIEAEATTGREMVVRLLGTQPTPAELPDSVLQHVVRTRESVILDDACAQNPFSEDEYIRHKRPRSLLCLALVNQARLIGVLYLENRLASHVFTRARYSVLSLLSSQAAISLENARLYAELTAENIERRRTDDALRQEVLERQRTEQLARMDEMRFRRFFDLPLIGMAVTSPERRFLEVNEKLCQILGYPREELLGRDWASITHPDDLSGNLGLTRRWPARVRVTAWTSATSIAMVRLSMSASRCVACAAPMEAPTTSC